MMQFSNNALVPIGTLMRDLEDERRRLHRYAATPFKQQTDRDRIAARQLALDDLERKRQAGETLLSGREANDVLDRIDQIVALRIGRRRLQNAGAATAYERGRVAGLREAKSLLNLLNRKPQTELSR